MLKVIELREKSQQELNAMLKDLREEVNILQLRKAPGVRGVRKDIARVLTVLNAKIST